MVERTRRALRGRRLSRRRTSTPSSTATTVATNAVLEHDGAVVGMITTRGFRDIVHIGRHQRPQHYSVMQDIPWQAFPFVRRRHRKVVSERIVPPTGEVLVALDEDEVRAAARELRERGRRGGRRLLPVLLPEPGARAARGRDRPRGDARRVRHDERRHRPPVPRVRALHDRVHERLRRAEDRRYLERLGPASPSEGVGAIST